MLWDHIGRALTCSRYITKEVFYNHAMWRQEILSLAHGGHHSSKPIRLGLVFQLSKISTLHQGHLAPCWDFGTMRVITQWIWKSRCLFGLSAFYLKLPQEPKPLLGDHSLEPHPLAFDAGNCFGPSEGGRWQEFQDVRVNGDKKPQTGSLSGCGKETSHGRCTYIVKCLMWSQQTTEIEWAIQHAGLLHHFTRHVIAAFT